MIDLVDSFLRASLEAAGAVIDTEGDVLHVLLPSEVAASLGVDEELRVSTTEGVEELHAGTSRPAPEALRLEGIERRERVAGRNRDVLDASLGSALLDRLVTKRLSQAVVTAVALPGELPRGLPDDVPVLLNAVRREEPDRERKPARYAIADMLLTLHSDEVRSAVANTSIRLADGTHVAALSLATSYSSATGRSSAPRGLDEGERAVLTDSLRAWVSRHGLAPFAATLEGVARRARRDLERLADYYRSLDTDMARAVRRARSAEEKARRQAKRELLPVELAARKEQLRERLRPRLATQLLAVRLVETEVDEFIVPVRRRARSGSVRLLRRAGDGRLEGPACAACGQETLRIYLCDERLHVLCSECGQEGRIDASRCAACAPRRRERRAEHAVSRSIVIPAACS